jgi:hypothetical protein
MSLQEPLTQRKMTSVWLVRTGATPALATQEPFIQRSDFGLVGWNPIACFGWNAKTAIG